MRTSKSQSAFMLAIILALIFVSVSLSAADFQAKGYETPAFVDVESTELRVNEPAGTVTINLFRSGDFRQTSTVDYQTSEVEASEGQDYKGSGGTITFQPGETFKSVVLQITADTEAESAESFRFELTASSANTVLGRASTTIWIDDAPAAISQPELEITAAEQGKILLSWTGSTPCALERSADPASGFWEPVACNPVIEDDRHKVSQPMGATFYFYRLRTE
jgi:hypothetical protein